MHLQNSADGSATDHSDEAERVFLLTTTVLEMIGFDTTPCACAHDMSNRLIWYVFGPKWWMSRPILGVKKPAQSSLSIFPSKPIGKKLRRFNSSWYVGRPWLEYSQKADKCFCCAMLVEDSAITRLRIKVHLSQVGLLDTVIGRKQWNPAPRIQCPWAVAETWRRVWGGGQIFRRPRWLFSEKSSILPAKISDDLF